MHHSANKQTAPHMSVCDMRPMKGSPCSELLMATTLRWYNYVSGIPSLLGCILSLNHSEQLSEWPSWNSYVPISQKKRQRVREVKSFVPGCAALALVTVAVICLPHKHEDGGNMGNISAPEGLRQNVCIHYTERVYGHPVWVFPKALNLI